MTNLATFRVHIAPLGFEVDRITIPLKQTKADKLWLLAHDNRSDDLSAPYLEKIKKECKKLGVEVKIAYSDRLSIFKAIKSIKDIIEEEKNNYIYVNVASGSKIQAIACMMACMVLKNCDNLKPFYAQPEKYAAFEGKQQSFGIKDTIALPTYEIQTPKPKLLAALKIVFEQKGQKMTKKDMAKIAEEQGIITINSEEKNHSQARFASLDKNIIAPLEKEWKFIEIEKIGRNRWIKITEEGQNAAEFLI
ncbi:MAG: HFX_2341 family transcriptional regulator domain-containing protein [Candidatus Nitrosopumilus sp. bin_6a]